jgi:COP9 signalosome complex subunit 4
MDLQSLIQTINSNIQNQDYDSIRSIFSSFGGQQRRGSVGQGEQRSLSAHFIHVAVASPSFLPDAFDHIEDVIIKALGHLPVTVENAADNALRQKLFDYKINHPTNADYAGAARVLAELRMEDDSSSVYYITPADKMYVFVKIAECFLADDETEQADAAVTKAGSLVQRVNAANNKALVLRYKSTYARVLDSNRKFLQAAQRYHELSEAFDLVDAESLLQMLGRAVSCAILAPSGPQRQRILAHIYKDNRLDQLDSISGMESHSKILKKMYMHQILQPQELVQFEASLMDHQKAIMGDGLTIMERGVIEHNMVAVGNLYQAIYFTELARILGVSPEKAEMTAANMIMDGSLRGSIDQVEGLLEFEDEEEEDVVLDRAITGFCTELNNVTDAIKAATT